MNARLRRPVLALTAVAAATCGGPDDGPTRPPPGGTPGFLQVQVALPVADVGALVITLRGPDVDSIRAEPGLTAYHAVTGPDVVRAFVAGPLPHSGTLLRFWVPDVDAAGSYVGTADEAAASDYSPLSVAGATVSVVP